MGNDSLGMSVQITPQCRLLVGAWHPPPPGRSFWATCQSVFSFLPCTWVNFLVVQCQLLSRQCGIALLRNIQFTSWMCELSPELGTL